MSHSGESAFLDLQRQVDEMFEELIYRPWVISGRAAGWRPPLDLHETADAYLVEMDLAGIAPDQISVLVSERNLSITAQRPSAALEGVLSQHCERRFGTFHREVRFSEAVDPQQARADYLHGTCRIILPKQRRTEGPQNAGMVQADLTVSEGRYLVRVEVP